MNHRSTSNHWIQLAGIVLFAMLTNNIYASPTSNSQTAELQLLQGKLGQLTSNVSFTYQEGSDLVRFLIVNGGDAIPQPYNGKASLEAETSAINFLIEYAGLFGNNYKPEYSLIKNSAVNDRHIVKLRQTVQGVPVFAGEMVVRMNSALQVTGVNGEITSNLDSFSLKADVTDNTALKEAISLVSKHYQVDSNGLDVNTPSLWIYNPALTGSGPDQNKLVWRMEVTGNGDDVIRELVMVDARTGEIAFHLNQIMDIKNREIHDNANTPNSTLPGPLVLSEGGVPSPIAEVMNAYNYSGDTYDFYFSNHGRDSLNDAGMTLVSTVRHCPGSTCPYQNAYWNGAQMAYGDGFAAADDVVGHELTHGVTNFTSNLIYENESGAINESFSDVWGEFIDLTNTGGTDTAAVRWQMGEDIPGIGAIRNMANPGAFGDPDKISSSNYYCGTGDHGGVHTNSGVNNKAAYLMADGDTFNGFTVAGIGIVKTAKIYYEAQTNILTSGSTYADLYTALQVACNTLVGTDGITTGNCSSVKDALDAVEMNTPPCTIPPAPVCPVGSTPSDLFNDGLESGLGLWTHAADVGSDVWSLSTLNPATGTKHVHGSDISTVSDSHIKTNTAIVLPASAYMRFDHYYDFEYDFDGGVVEYSLDNGANWIDAGSLITDNNYTGTLSTGYSNPLSGRSAYTKNSMGYTSSRLDLGSLAGSNVNFRFRVGTDSSVSGHGWDIDNVRIYTCGTAEPTISTPVPGSTLSGSTETFTVDYNGLNVTRWAMWIGSSEGTHDIGVIGAVGSTSATANSLPTDGSAVYTRLFYKVNGGSWAYANDYTYTASIAVTTPSISAPVPGSTLSGSTETFTVDYNGLNVTRWAMWIGSSVGTHDIGVVGAVGSTAATANSLPTDGSAVYVRLFYKVNGGAWAYANDYTYTAYNN